MKPRRVNATLCFFGFCLVVVLSYAIWSRSDRCDRLAELTAKVVRLYGSYPRAYSFSDHVVGLLHRSDPLAYYEKVAHSEKKALLASGQLVEFRIPYTADGPQSDREIAKALYAVWQRTGAHYWIEFDRTNRLMLVACRPRDTNHFQIPK